MNSSSLEYIYVIILGMAAVSYFSRELPFILLKGRKLKPAIVQWMSFIPTAVLAALLLPALILDSKTNSFFISISNDFLLAGIATFIFSYFVENLFAVVVFGIVFLAILRNFIM